MSGGRRCPDCGSAALEEEALYAQQQLVCTDCGFIITEGLLTTSQQEEAGLQAVRFSDSTGENDTISKAKLKGIVYVRNLCRVLHLPSSFADTAVSYYERAFHHPAYHGTSLSKKEAIMGCCVYITCRQHRWPLTMATISSMLYAKQELFSSMFLDITQNLKLDVPSLSLQDFVKSHLRSFRLLQNSSSAPAEYIEDLNKVLERALQLTELAGETWLVTGRHPIPIIAAAAYLSWQSLKPTQRLTCRFHRFCQLCETEVPGPSAKRIKEMLGNLSKLAEQLPWLRRHTINNKTVIQHLGDILKHRAYLLRNTLAAKEPITTTESEETGQHGHASTFLPPCMTNLKKRSYISAFPEGRCDDVTGDEEILDSEIEQYLRTPAEIKEYEQAQAKILQD
ncbi:transcription factor IIIB 50 kDa subunit [Gastrophryne carolinensis]